MWTKFFSRLLLTGLLGAGLAGCQAPAGPACSLGPAVPCCHAPAQTGEGDPVFHPASHFFPVDELAESSSEDPPAPTVARGLAAPGAAGAETPLAEPETDSTGPVPSRPDIVVLGKPVPDHADGFHRLAPASPTSPVATTDDEASEGVSAPGRPPWEPEYLAALSLARRITEVQRAGLLTAARQENLTQAYGDLAVDLLQQAVAKGFADGTQLRKDADLQPLAARPDFEKLLHDMHDADQQPEALAIPAAESQASPLTPVERQSGDYAFPLPEVKP
jgi:hypothetical protein